MSVIKCWAARHHCESANQMCGDGLAGLDEYIYDLSFLYHKELKIYF